MMAETTSEKHAISPSEPITAMSEVTEASDLKVLPDGSHTDIGPSL